jgi:aminoglycoside phosphotransferase (APT) family kinase protein
MPSATAGERQAAYTAMAQTLAALHNVDFRTVGLQKFGRHSGYCSRQVTSFGLSKLWNLQ